MYKQTIPWDTRMEINDGYEGETIEKKVRRVLNNKEPITDSAPLVYTERKDGVQPEYNIRTDRFEIAVEAMDSVSKSHTAKREERHKAPTGEEMAKGMAKEGGETPANTSDSKNN